MRIPALIVGGGPAGSAAAITLARAGLASQLFEAADAHGNGVCGGFLGWDALAALRDLGIDVEALGARPITRLRLLAGNRCIEMALPQAAAGLSRRTLDRALIAAAEAAGAHVAYGRQAKSVDPLSRAIRFGDGEILTADALFLATGKHELRGLPRDLAHRRAPPAVGLRASLRPTPPRERELVGVIELHLFDGGYAGLLLQEDGTVNLCLSVARARLAAVRTIPALITEILDKVPSLAARIGCEPLPSFTAVARVPYGWSACTTYPGIFRIGDQGAVIASLAGDGIAIALTSGASAAEALLTGGPERAGKWQAGWHRTSHRPLAVAEALRRGAERPIARRLLMHALHLAPRLGTHAALLTRIGGTC